MANARNSRNQRNWAVRSSSAIAASARKLSRNGWLFLASIGAVAAAQATMIWAPKVGIYIDAAAVVALVALAMTSEKMRKVAIGLGIIPVANMVLASTLPSGNLGSIVVYDDLLLVLAVIYRFMFTLDEPVTSTRLTAKGYATALPLMAVIGQAIGVFGYIFLRHHYEFRGYPLPLVAAIAVVLAFCEEILLRGLIQQQAAKVFHPLTAAFATAGIYVLLALEQGNWLTVPVAVVLGSALAYTYYRKNNLILTFTMNAASKLVYIGLIAGFILR